jgi:hypothetical protein
LDQAREGNRSFAGAMISDTTCWILTRHSTLPIEQAFYEVDLAEAEAAII